MSEGCFVFPEIDDDLEPEAVDLSDEEYHVFISHSSEDEGTVNDLVGKLNKLGFKSFTSGKDFLPGREIVLNIQRGVENSQKMIVIVTKPMLKSNWVEFEVAECRNKEKRNEEALLIPVLCGVDRDETPSYLQENFDPIDGKDKEFWHKLCSAVTRQFKLSKIIPVGNIGQGLAWSYYYGYLSIIVPGLAEKIDIFEVNEAAVRKCYKLFIVIPESCKMPNKVEGVDEKFTQAGDVDQEFIRAGKNRSYKVHLYRIKDPKTGIEYLLPLIFTSTLSVMHQMEQSTLSNLDSAEKRSQMIRFKKKLEEIFDHTSCKNRTLFINYKDTPEIEVPLSSLVLNRLQSDESLLRKPNQ